MKVNRTTPWLFAAPTLVLVGAVFLFPLIAVFRYSLENVGISSYVPTTFAGLSNFRFIYSDPLFVAALENNLKLFLCVPFMALLSVILAAILFDRPRGWKVYRTMLFLPYVISIPVVGVVFGYMFERDGIINSGLRAVGLGGVAPDWLGSSSWALPTIMIVIIWKELGFGIVLCLARLMSVDEHLFEAARVDGARWWKVLRHVTVPQLAPALVFYVIVELINMLSWVFAYVYVMTLGGPENSTVVSEYYIYQAVFQDNVIGIGAAAGVTLLAVVSMLIIVRVWMRRRFLLGYE